MNSNNSKSGRMSGGWAKWTLTAAVLAGTALWSGCDKSMESMAKRVLSAGALGGDEGISGGLIGSEDGLWDGPQHKAIIADELFKEWSFRADSSRPSLADYYRGDRIKRSDFGDASHFDSGDKE